MAEILLFHHAQGLTEGCLAFAAELRGAGHVVHAPDLYEGRTFDSLAEGVGHAQQIGFDTIIERGAAVAEGLLRIHLMEDDEFVLPPEADLEAARDLDADAAAVLRSRVLGFLDGLA